LIAAEHRRRIDRLPDGEIHAIGPAGLETASMVRYLVERGRDDIVLHDTSTDRDNATAAAAAALVCGSSNDDLEQRSVALTGATPRYRQQARQLAERLFVNDAASCMPASTAALVTAQDRPFVLICGGDRQRYRPGEFDQLAAAVRANPHTALVCTMGPMADHIAAALHATGFAEPAVVHAADLETAVERALDVTGTTVVFSPGCGTGSLFTDKYTRGEAFDDAVTKLLSNDQAIA
jgi:UDP-N-acetylmuramoylalanine-D-glutamate ligase